MSDDRETEKTCLAKINARARKLIAANPTLNMDLARGKAVELMPNTTQAYLEARSRLVMRGIRPLQFEDID